MTGEMSKSDLKDYPQFFALAKRLKKAGLRAEVVPFDVYQGPYVLVENKVKIWGTEYKTVWFIEDKSDGLEGFATFSRDVVKDTKCLLKKLQKYE